MPDFDYFYNSTYPYEYMQNNFAYWDREAGSNSKVLSLRVDGIGTIKVQPNIAVAFLGVITENKELSKAQVDNAAKTQKVIDAILKLGIEEKDIKTESFSITPEYDFVEGKQVFRAYRVNNNLRVTVRNVQDIGKVIDTAVASGANAVYNVNFSLDNISIVYNNALSLAIKDAVNKAGSVESTLNIAVDLIPVKITEESNMSAETRDRLFSLQSPAASTVIKSGEIEITAKIRAVFNYEKL